MSNRPAAPCAASAALVALALAACIATAPSTTASGPNGPVGAPAIGAADRDALAAGEVRIVASSFHVIGEVFDRVWREAASEPASNVQTTLVPAGGAAIVDLRLDAPGAFALVDHSLGRLEKGAAGILAVEGAGRPDVFAVGARTEGGHAAAPADDHAATPHGH